MVRIFVVFVVAFDVAFVWQKCTGAYESEFGAHPDEGAHCVTGLFVRDAFGVALDYVRNGFQGSPVDAGREFAQNFYEHYPKVALGVWPPAFHLTQAVWTLPFGTSRMALLLLMAALAASVAVLIFEVVRPRFGMWAAAGAALLWLCGPLVREYYGMIMAEMLSTLTMLGATVVWGRYLEKDSKRDAWWFALLASAAILTKGTGLALNLMCLFSIILRWNWRVLARPSLWGAALLIVVLAGIWTWVFRHEGLRVGGWERSGLSWEFTKAAVPFYAWELARSLGYGVAVFALIGMFTNARKDGHWAAQTSLVVAVLVFQSVVPVGREARHVLPATPALMLLAMAGVFAVARHPKVIIANAGVQRYRERMWIVLLALLMVPQIVFRFERKSYHGFEPLARAVLEEREGTRILISSDARGEGMFISEVAMRDRRPNLFIERASKTLVDPEGRTWGGRYLRDRFPDDATLLDYILKSKIEYIVLDAAVPEEKRAPYQDQLKRVVMDNTGTFWPVTESPVHRDNEDLFPPVRLIRVVRDRVR